MFPQSPGSFVLGEKLSGLLEDVTFTEILCWFYLFKLIYSHHACQRKRREDQAIIFLHSIPPPPTPFLLSRFNPKNVLLHEVLQLQHLLLEINRFVYLPSVSTFLSAHFKPCPCLQMRILLYISVVSLKASLHSWIKAALCLLKTLCVDVMPHESLNKQCQLWPNSAPSIKVHGYHCRVNAYMPPALNSLCKDT